MKDLLTVILNDRIEEIFDLNLSTKDLGESLNKQNQTPLHLITDPSVLKYLIPKSDNVNIKDKYRRTPLYMYSMIASSVEDVFQVFKDNGANPFIVDDEGLSSIDIALKIKNKAPVNFFSEYIKFEIESIKENICFFDFFRGDLPSAYKNLNDINDLFGKKTLLMHAVETNNPHMVTQLLLLNPDVEIKNENNETALSFLKKHKVAKEIVTSIEQFQLNELVLENEEFTRNSL